LRALVAACGNVPVDAAGGARVLHALASYLESSGDELLELAPPTSATRGATARVAMRAHAASLSAGGSHERVVHAQLRAALAHGATSDDGDAGLTPAPTPIEMRTTVTPLHASATVIQRAWRLAQAGGHRLPRGSLARRVASLSFAARTARPRAPAEARVLVGVHLDAAHRHTAHLHARFVAAYRTRALPALVAVALRVGAAHTSAVAVELASGRRAWPVSSASASGGDVRTAEALVCVATAQAWRVCLEQLSTLYGVRAARWNGGEVRCELVASTLAPLVASLVLVEQRHARLLLAPPAAAAAPPMLASSADDDADASAAAADDADADDQQTGGRRTKAKKRAKTRGAASAARGAGSGMSSPASRRSAPDGAGDAASNAAAAAVATTPATTSGPVDELEMTLRWPHGNQEQ
jgi:hypothetical protein